MFDQSNNSFFNEPSNSINNTNSMIQYAPSEINTSQTRIEEINGIAVEMKENTSDTTKIS